MSFQDAKKELEALNYRLMSYREDAKRGRTVIDAVFRWEKESVYFHHEYVVSFGGKTRNEIKRWSIGKPVSF